MTFTKLLIIIDINGRNKHILRKFHPKVATYEGYRYVKLTDSCPLPSHYCKAYKSAKML